MKLKDNEIDTIIDLYTQGLSIADIRRQTNHSPETIKKYITQVCAYHRGYKYQFSDEDIQHIADLYCKGDYDTIFAEYKDLNQQRLYSLMSSNGHHKPKVWNHEDIEKLQDLYYQGLSYDEIAKQFGGKFSPKNLASKAYKLGLTKSKKWNDEELKLLEENYALYSPKEISDMLPGRTYDSVIHMAQKLNLKSNINRSYSNEEDAFIKQYAGVLTDSEIATELQRTQRGVKARRGFLGIYYTSHDYSGYENIGKILRGQLQEWKNQSMESCNYQCVISGSKDFEIHHLYGFNSIVCESIDFFNAIFDHQLDESSLEDIHRLIDIFHDIHKQYPLGVCVRKDLHNMFHDIYGRGNNTEDQWNQFINKQQWKQAL